MGLTASRRCDTDGEAVRSGVKTTGLPLLGLLILALYATKAHGRYGISSNCMLAGW